ncbi:MAG: hypothetical protein ABFD65_16825, partial [Candidatus Polarisedimenticolia bacterium]
MAQKKTTKTTETGRVGIPGVEYLEGLGAETETGEIGETLETPTVPIRLMVSGLYRQTRVPTIEPIPQRGIPTGATTLVEGTETTATTPVTPSVPIWQFNLNELRLDVDGNDPQMTASGVNYIARGRLVNWVA